MSLEKEFGYYKEHQEELVAKYEGKFLLIVEEQVQGAFESEFAAYQAGKERFKAGTFLIQQCLPGKDSYTQTFHSRVAFR